MSLATIARYLPNAKPDPSSDQRWLTFLRDHRDLIAGMGFFLVPTVRFHLLYVWFAIDHGRRRILHFNVTTNPAARWVIQQLRSAFPDDPAHRFLIFDNDTIFSADVARSIAGFGIHPSRTAFRSPWQNGTAERFVGTVRRELLDHVVVLSEEHLRRLLRESVAYYNTERVHTSIGDSPAGRSSKSRASRAAKIIRLPRVGGLQTLQRGAQVMDEQTRTAYHEAAHWVIGMYSASDGITFRPDETVGSLGHVAPLDGPLTRCDFETTEDGSVVMVPNVIRERTGEARAARGSKRSGV